mmetsp:Transcript_24484/g.61586  ORF Transcript_24484/g.61586 Transcript_24484/m.61586 type:complete len:347 (+) Transcript_24484:725-1765(+)
MIYHYQSCISYLIPPLASCSLFDVTAQHRLLLHQHLPVHPGKNVNGREDQASTRLLVHLQIYIIAVCFIDHLGVLLQQRRRCGLRLRRRALGPHHRFHRGREGRHWRCGGRRRRPRRRGPTGCSCPGSRSRRRQEQKSFRLESQHGFFLCSLLRQHVLQARRRTKRPLGCGLLLVLVSGGQSQRQKRRKSRTSFRSRRSFDRSEAVCGQRRQARGRQQLVPRGSQFVPEARGRRQRGHGVVVVRDEAFRRRFRVSSILGRRIFTHHGNNAAVFSRGCVATATRTSFLRVVSDLHRHMFYFLLLFLLLADVDVAGLVVIVPSLQRRECAAVVVVVVLGNVAVVVQIV